MEYFKTATGCRSCNCSLRSLWDLGDHHIVGFPQPGDPPRPKVPLVLAQCAACGLVQLHHTVPPEALFRHYWYASAVNESMVAALKDIVDEAKRRRPVGPFDWVVDIGANDGTLLSFYKTPAGPFRSDPMRMAFEPALNLQERLARHCEVRVSEFFPQPLLASAAIITAIAMFYDLDEPNAFVAAIAKWLAPDGLFVVQVGYVGSMLTSLAFDSICHEHLEYYSLTSMVSLLARHGLVVEDVAFNNVNGGSMRCYIRHADYAGPSQAVLTTLNREGLLGLGEPGPYLELRNSVEKVRAIVRDYVIAELREGGCVDVYGASTKGLTLMQYMGLDKTQIRWAVDRNPDKWGREYGQTGIPIVPEEQWRNLPGSMAIVLPWHFKTGILEREKDYRAGGRLLFPLPIPEVY